MHRACSSLVLLISGVSLFACAGGSARSGNYPVDGNVSSVSRADLAAAIAVADADRIYGVHVIDHNHVRVDITGDIHDVGSYDEKGRHVIERIHGEPMYVVVTRTGDKWERGGATITIY